MLEDDRIFVIGAGAMAEAFIRGVTKNNVVTPHQICVINKSRRERIDYLKATYGVKEAKEWKDAETAGLLVLSVKPTDVAEALQEVTPYLNHQVLVSFAAGVCLEQLEACVQYRAHCVRTMPNLPVSVSTGLTAISFSNSLNDDAKEFVLHLLRQLGDTVEIAEDLMDAVTAVSGSGPGFLCYILEAMENAATNLGFTPEVARRMLLQTLSGTIHTLREWDLSPRELRERVMSPGGTTFAGVQIMERRNVQQSIGEAIVAAKDRSTELGKALAQH